VALRSGALALILALTTACASSPGAPSQGLEASSKATERVAADQGPTEVVAAFEEGPIRRFRKANAMRHVRKLAADIGVRVRATTAERRGARYVARRFEAMGYKVNIQRFSVDGGTSRNVVAWWPESRRYGVVVGGHMDSVPGSPGANDNASGVAVVLEVARLMAGKEPARSVRFVAFGSEEYGSDGSHHVGSQIYVNRLGTEGRNRLGGMVSVDMVADGRPLLVGNSGIAHDVVARTLYRKVRNAGIAVQYHVLCDCSDHGPFEHAGIPAAFAYSGREPDYHSSSDTVPNMNPNHLLRTGKAIRAFVKAVDREMLQRFRQH
jgi:hypothetical protein